MKTKLLILFFISSYLLSNAQEFATVGAKWHYSFTPWSYPLRNEAILVESIKDTVVNNINCRKMSGVGSNFIYSSGNKVFIFNNFINDFVKIYDFDLQAGDTLKFKYANDSSISAYIIDSVEFMSINSKIKKIQYISPQMPNMNGDNMWVFYGYNIEGIGNNNYLFPQFALADPLINGGLRCYEDSIIGYYNTGIVSVCDSTILLGINENEFLPFKLYPNPAKDYIFIESNSGNALAEIFSIDGKLQKKYSIFYETSININDLAKGLYIIKLQTEKGYVYGKFIKL